MENKNINLDDILWWILQHTDDTNAMDKISNASFPYTHKYKSRFGDRPQDDYQSNY